MSIYILGINLSHDRSACLLKDGKIIIAIAEERLDRNKGSVGRIANRNYRLPPFLAINYCINSINIELDKLDLIVADNAVEEVDLDFLRKIIPIKDKGKIRSIPHPSHHMAHACSAYFCSSFRESAILVADVYGSEIPGKGNEGESVFFGKGNEINNILSTYQKIYKYNNGTKRYYSLTYIYRFITQYLGFIRKSTDKNIPIWGRSDEAGKTMGLASYGKHRNDWETIVKIHNNTIDTSKFYDWAIKNNIAYSRNGFLIPKIISIKNEKFSQFHKDLAFKAQEELERGMIWYANLLYKKTKCTNLCIAGGAGLNCINNTKIKENTPFEKIFIQPAATDDGNAIGCAFYGWHIIKKQRLRFKLKNVYFGRKYKKEEIKSSLEEYNISLIPLDQKSLIRKTVEMILNGKIVGWFQNGSEFGPRALGNRSILADPRRTDIKPYLDKFIKNRESFRPYGCSILIECLTDYFEITFQSQFMLFTAKVNTNKKEIIPAVIHVDGTSRIQTVSKSDNRLFYILIREFFLKSGVPVLLNTSFNIRGKPIVETPLEALNVFANTHMDAIVLGNYFIDKNDKLIKTALNKTKNILNICSKFRKINAGV